jgi:6-pyruvoyltetrahydropterin/6-carboxytetrahydropterin synthase
LFNPSFSDEKNWEVFGPCSNPHGHGHNYILDVTVQGNPDPQTGMIINLRDLADVISREITDPLDHKHLNLDVPWLEGVIPTLENLAVRIWERLAKALAPGILHAVSLYESESNFVVYHGK